MKKTEISEGKATRQCWECMKRRLVCDHTLPHCKKCQKAGKDCPGYDEQKPLQWVETGKVTSRRRRKDCPPKVYKIAQPESIKRKESLLPESQAGVLDPARPLPVLDELELDPECASMDTQLKLTFSIWKSADKALWGYLDDEYDEENLRTYAARFQSGSMEVDRLFAHGGRSKLEELVARRDHGEAARYLKDVSHPLDRLERVLKILQAHDLPNYDYLTVETNEVVQAVNYYNVRIHPTMKAAGELAPNPALIYFPLNALHVLPPAIHHTLVCLSLNHYIHSLPSGADKSLAMKNRSKVYHHRGEAIRALSQYVGKDKTRCSDFTIASILMFLSTELQNPAMSDWRSHANGIQRLIEMRGGMKSLIKQSPHLAPTIVVYVLIMTIANTCSPSWDPIEMTGTPEENLEDIKSMYNLIFPYTLCPPAVFFDVLRINQLRHKASASMLLGDMDPVQCLEAHDLLGNIESFVPEDWAQPGANYDEWLTIGTVYQAATAVYCTMSFQSLTILPNTLEMNSMRKVHGDRLLDGLRKAIKSPRLVHFMMWPLTVAGVEAGYRDSATQYWIEKKFEHLGRTLGTSSPLKAQAVLRRYWQKQEPGWDECFDRPYVFVI